ncbi:hypothetical protein D3C81_2076000 [compost metagenome]
MVARSQRQAQPAIGVEHDFPRGKLRADHPQQLQHLFFAQIEQQAFGHHQCRLIGRNVRQPAQFGQRGPDQFATRTRGIERAAQRDHVGIIHVEPRYRG